MKCLLCESFSLLHICKPCQKNFLTPSIHKRKVQDIEVISFYKYKDIKNLLHTKHTDIGYYIYTILAENSFHHFAKEFVYEEKIVSLAIDDNPKAGYSHTAILNKSLQSQYIQPLHNKLRARNDVSYSGKSKAFRLQNKRDFQVSSFTNSSLIVVDDIITTGTTLNEAITTLKREKKEPLFCLTLAESS